MATNDVLLIDGVIDELVEQNPGMSRGDLFELFAISQILKDWDLKAEEIRSGWIDGRGDGGIDGFYVIVNGHCINEISDFVWPKASADILVYIITCKHADKFSQAALDALIASLTEIFDLSIADENLVGSYSKELLLCRSRLITAYRKLAPRLGAFKVAVFYASRGDAQKNIGDEVAARSQQIKELVARQFTGAEACFDFLGATELVKMHRKRPLFSLALPYISSLTQSGTYILLVNLYEYYKFCVDDETGNLRRYLFDSNVRDYMGLNRVNQDIIQTLSDGQSPDFWWLNNGVTILATSAWAVSGCLHMENIQVVNGLQTTESIFNHFSSLVSRGALSISDSRSLMVKVIVSEDAVARDRIIRATNNQTAVAEISLHATDKIQRDIEDALSAAGMLYERRKNHYVNQGASPGDTISPMYLAAGSIALLRKQPWVAVNLKQKHLRDSHFYDLVFDERVPLPAWPAIASILKCADSVLDSYRPKGNSEGFLKNNRYLLSFIAVAKRFGTFSFTGVDLVGLKVDDAFREGMQTAWNWMRINSHMQRGRTYAEWVCQQWARQMGVRNVNMVVAVLEKAEQKDLPDELINAVREALPPQPWKPGVHNLVRAKVGCSQRDLGFAINKLVDMGVFFSQRNGVLYDQNGKIVGFDPERVKMGGDGIPVKL